MRWRSMKCTLIIKNTSIMTPLNKIRILHFRSRRQMMKMMPLKKVKSSEKMTKKVLSQIKRTKMIRLRVCYKIWSGSQSQTNKTRRNFVSKLKSLKTICLPTCSRYSTNSKAILLVVKSRTRSSRTKLSRSVL